MGVFQVHLHNMHGSGHIDKGILGVHNAGSKLPGICHRPVVVSVQCPVHHIVETGVLRLVGIQDEIVHRIHHSIHQHSGMVGIPYESITGIGIEVLGRLVVRTAPARSQLPVGRIGPRNGAIIGTASHGSLVISYQTALAAGCLHADVAVVDTALPGRVAAQESLGIRTAGDTAHAQILA